MSGNAEKNHQVIIEILKEVFRVCNEAEITHFIAFGTLLGWRRENGIIPHDDDGDVYVSIKDWERFHAAMESKSKLHRLRPKRTTDICQLSAEPRSALGKKGVFVDVYFYTEKSIPVPRRILGNESKRIETIFDTWNAIGLERDDVFPLRPVQFLGENTFVPAMYERILYKLYGATYMTPKKGVKAKGRGRYIDKIYNAERVIWVVSLADEATVPDWLAQSCLDSWQRHNPDWTTFVVNETNIELFCNLKYIKSAVGAGEAWKAIPKDALRRLVKFYLLATYGGICTDADVYCTRAIERWIDVAAKPDFFTLPSQRAIGKEKEEASPLWVTFAPRASKQLSQLQQECFDQVVSNKAENDVESVVDVEWKRDVASKSHLDSIIETSFGTSASTTLPVYKLKLVASDSSDRDVPEASSQALAPTCHDTKQECDSNTDSEPSSPIRIPIFIIVHDRIEVLKKCLASLAQITTPYEVILYDSASTYQPCIDFLRAESLKPNTTLVTSAVNNHTLVMNAVEAYLKSHPQCEYYVLTDPDIELDAVNGDILEFYKFLCERFEYKFPIGPMLRIDDIPDTYPMKKRVIQSHTRQFWHKTPLKVEYNSASYDYQTCRIDTTFQLVSRRMKSQRKFCRPGIRTYAPYAARHLDWYLDPTNMSADQVYYSKHASRVAHWGRNIAAPKTTTAPVASFAANKSIAPVTPIKGTVAATAEQNPETTVMDTDYLRYVLYINLEHRSDRKDEIEKELRPLVEWDSKREMHRVDATRHAVGSIGCGLSHIKALKFAKEKKWPHALIVEDDFCWFDFLRPEPGAPMSAKELNTCEYGPRLLQSSPTVQSGKWDVLCLSVNLLKNQMLDKEHRLMRILDGQTTGAYIVQSHYYDILLQNFEQSTNTMLKCGKRINSSCIDIAWKRLQKQGNWLAIQMGAQRPGYSDIEKRMVNHKDETLNVLGVPERKSN